MTDLNTFLLEEGTRANNEGREPCFHLSPTLTTALSQVSQHGVIANSVSEGEDFLDFIDNIGHQFHPFNIMKVIAVNAADYDMLDPQQKFVFSHIMDEIMGEATLIVGDYGGVNRLFIGPASAFHIHSTQVNFNSLSPGQRQLIPNFQLPPGQTWAQFPQTVQNGATFALVQSQEVTQDVAAAPKKSVQRVPRPPNPFIIYRAAHHKSVADAHPDATNNEISKKIGRQWQNETDEVRNLYRGKAAEIKAAFMAAHPDYKYKPRKSSEVKRRAKKNTVDSQDDEDLEEYELEE